MKHISEIQSKQIQSLALTIGKLWILAHSPMYALRSRTQKYTMIHCHPYFQAKN